MSLLEIQQLFNTDTRDCFDLWKPFRDLNREEVYKRVLNRNNLDYNHLLLLGAGNGNDIDISFFEEIFNKITIVDIDETALDHLLSKVKYPEKFKKKLMDLSGVTSQVDMYDFSNKTASQIETFIRKIQVKHDFSELSSAKYDCIINCNYTSQLVFPFFLKSLYQHNINPTSKLTNELVGLVKKIIEGIFLFIGNHLAPKGIIFHSTDTFEVWHDQTSGDKYSDGFEEIMLALRGNIFDTTPLQDFNVYKSIEKHRLTGGYIPEGFKPESFRFVPWRFSFNENFVKFYICSVYALKKTHLGYDTLKKL
ncbi:hypothetical protein ACFQZE_07145 [Paenibacillus sp. GCM10027627]|uniref:hypothetical protein n=1 Tax=unclassified Paenibacillus TaxID=185978 RepID=UPI00362A2C5D